MSFIEWSPTYLLKIPKIDSQHRQLFDILNELHESGTSGDSREAVREALKRLIGYTIYHFSTEETLMRSYGYQDYPQHKTEHDNLRDRVMVLEEAGKSDTGVEIEELTGFLKTWLSQHILRTDMKFAKYVEKLGIDVE